MSIRAMDSARVDHAASAHARRLRTYAWAALPLLATAYYALLMVPLPPLVRVIALELVYCTPIVLTVVWSVKARALSEGSERIFWGALAVALTTLFTCELLLVLWVAFISPAGPPRVSWPFHIMHAVAATAFVIAISSLSRFVQVTSATRIRWSFDVAAVSLLAGVLLLEAYVKPVMEPAGATVPEVLLGVSYPLFALVMVAGTLGNLVGFKVDRWRSWDKLVAVSLIIYAIAISIWPIWFTTAAETSRNYQRGVLDLVQFSGHWLLMAAAVYRLTEVREWRLRPLPPLDSSRHRWLSALVPGAVLLGVPVMGLLAVQAGPESPWFRVYVGAFTALTALALLRGMLIALENGVLFHRSVTDPLTGLHNRRFFLGRLAEEIERARRYGDEVTVIAVDIDRFTEVNERLGHPAAERLLQEVATLLRSRCGEDCVVARLQGDDFGVIAPCTGPLEGSVIARRMIDSVTIGGGDEPGTVTVSAGVASFPRHADDVDGLMRVARGALYQAKQSGSEGLVSYEDERVVDLSAQERIERLERQSRLASVRALIAAIGARSEESVDHSTCVAALALRVADELGVSDEVAARTETAALLHDIAVIASQDPRIAAEDILNSHDRSADKSHLAVEQKVLAASGLADLLPIVRSYYEWWDGTGQPQGLKGDEIQIESRILAVCDAYDTMTTDRPYRMALSRRHAREQLASLSGTQFDPSVVDALFRVLDSGAPVSPAHAVDA